VLTIIGQALISFLNALFDFAGVAELADANDSKSCSFGSVGSTPTTGIKLLDKKGEKALGLRV
jgi:hypothetical protein